MCFKRELRLATLCHGKRPPPSSIDYVRTTQLCPRKRPFSTANQRFSSTSGEKSGLGLLSATSNPHQLIQRLEKTCGASHQGSSTSPKIDARLVGGSIKAFSGVWNETPCQTSTSPSAHLKWIWRREKYASTGIRLKLQEQPFQ